MTNQDAMLSATNIRYLLALHELDNGETGARSSQIAESLGVTKPSVHTMIKKFCERGYVTKEKYEAIHLTSLGRQLAENYSEQYALLYSKMECSLGLTPEGCCNAVCAVLAQTVSSESMSVEE